MSDGLTKDPDSIILGIRDFTDANVPLRSYIGNKITSFGFFLLFRYKLQDTQTGLRGVPLKHLPVLIQLKGERYEYEINMLIYAIKRRIRLRKIPIQTLYFNNNEGSYYHAVKDSLKIFNRLMIGFLYFHGQFKK